MSLKTWEIASKMEQDKNLENESFVDFLPDNEEDWYWWDEDWWDEDWWDEDWEDEDWEDEDDDFAVRYHLGDGTIVSIPENETIFQSIRRWRKYGWLIEPNKWPIGVYLAIIFVFPLIYTGLIMLPNQIMREYDGNFDIFNIYNDRIGHYKNRKDANLAAIRYRMKRFAYFSIIFIAIALLGRVIF
jgi:hypothetical protein